MKKEVVLIHVLLAIIACRSEAGTPSNYLSAAWSEGAGQVTIAPCGGDSLMSYQFGHNYTIHIQLLDMGGEPVSFIPSTDIGLYLPEASSCGNYLANADRPTDLNGETLFTGPCYGGIKQGYVGVVDCNELELYVQVYGEIINEGNSVDVSIDSVDLNGDMEVNLGDWSLFASVYGCNVGCDSCRDFDDDGDIDIADMGIMAAYLNVCDCP